jgi:heat shock protein HtpX
VVSAVHRRYPRDLGLGTRMVVVMFLLGLLYVGFSAVLVNFGAPTVMVLILGAGMLVFQYWFSDRMALFAMNARTVEADEEPEIHGMLDRLCALADLPKPRLAVADTDLPNAFATGRNPKTAIICVTTGLKARLEPAELEAVMAHELSHVAHRDVAVMTLAGAAGMVAGLIGRFAVELGLFGGDDDDESGGGGIAFVVVLILSAFVYLVAFLLTRLLSRYRELAADRGAAAVTGAPSTLASALTKTSGDLGRIPLRDLRAAEPLNAFFFTPARASGFSLSSLFATHPSLERRLRQLSELERSLTGPA